MEEEQKADPINEIFAYLENNCMLKLKLLSPLLSLEEMLMERTDQNLVRTYIDLPDGQEYGLVYRGSLEHYPTLPQTLFGGNDFIVFSVFNFEKEELPKNRRRVDENEKQFLERLIIELEEERENLRKEGLDDKKKRAAIKTKTKEIQEWKETHKKVVESQREENKRVLYEKD